MRTGGDRPAETVVQRLIRAGSENRFAVELDLRFSVALEHQFREARLGNIPVTRPLRPQPLSLTGQQGLDSARPELAPRVGCDEPFTLPGHPKVEAGASQALGP